MTGNDSSDSEEAAYQGRFSPLWIPDRDAQTSIETALREFISYREMRDIAHGAYLAWRALTKLQVIMTEFSDKTSTEAEREKHLLLSIREWQAANLETLQTLLFRWIDQPNGNQLIETANSAFSNNLPAVWLGDTPVVSTTATKVIAILSCNVATHFVSDVKWFLAAKEKQRSGPKLISPSCHEVSQKFSGVFGSFTGNELERVGSLSRLETSRSIDYVIRNFAFFKLNDIEATRPDYVTIPEIADFTGVQTTSVNTAEWGKPEKKGGRSGPSLYLYPKIKPHLEKTWKKLIWPTLWSKRNLNKAIDI